MPRVTVETTLEVPSGLFVYDVGGCTLACVHCGKSVVFGVIDNGPLASGELTVEGKFKMFVSNHTRCLIQFVEEIRQQNERTNSQRGGPGDR